MYNYKKRILEKLQDLKEKIEMEEPTPDAQFDDELLCVINEALDEALNCWYY